MTVFNVTVDAGCTSTTTVSKVNTYRFTQADTLAFPWVFNALAPALGLTVSGGGSSFNFTSTLNRTWVAGAAIREACGVAGSLGVNQVLKQILAQQFGLTDFFNVGRPITIAQAMNVAPAITAVLGALIAERLGLVSTTAPNMTYKQTLLEALAFRDGLVKFLTGVVMENLNVAQAFVSIGNYKPTISETMNVAQTMTPKLIAIVTVPQTFAFTDAQTLQMVFKPTISEVLSFDIGIIDPGGGFTTWAVNTRTGSTTEYSNYVFNSFASSGHHYLGASSTGLYVLEGADDDGTPTIASLRSGYAQFGGSRYSAFQAAYLGMRGDGNVYLKLDAGTGETYTYQVVLQNRQTTKVRIGKGLRARYFAWELVTTGQDFDLDSVEFIPLVAQRRV